MNRTTIEPLESRIAPAVIFTVEVATNKLVSFDSSTPGTLLGDVTITGLQANEVIAAIDFRPATGELYGLGIINNGATRAGDLYKINPTTAVATLVGNGPFSTTLGATDRYGFDFNPVVDRIRVTNDLDANFRLNPDDGTISGTDTNISDGAASNEQLVAVAYDRNYGSNLTTLYGYDFQTDNLVSVGGVNGNPSPNGGLLTTVARAKLGGVNFTSGTSLLGFDIAGDYGGPDVGWIGMEKAGQSGAHLYNIDLATAALTDLGQIGSSARNFGGLAVKLDGPAPVISTDGKTATWHDLDGDNVTLKITKGTLTAANFRMLQGANETSALSKLTITDAAFTGTNITVTAKPGLDGGDGAVNIGEINATGVDLGSVTIGGDLVAIDAGTDATPALSIKALTARSVAAYGSGPARGPGIEAVTSTIADGVGKVTVAGDFAGNLFLEGGKSGSITIGGDLAGNAAFAQLANLPGSKLGKLFIKGSVIGGIGGSGLGAILLEGVGSAFIGGSIVGEDGSSGGLVDITGSGKTTVNIGGSIIGGSGLFSGRVSTSGVAAVTVAGSVIGDSGQNSGGISVSNPAVKIAIGGSLLGGDGSTSGSITGSGKAGIAIKGDIRGGDGADSGHVTVSGAPFTNSIASLTIGGSVHSGANSITIASRILGSVTIKGGVTGSSAAPVIIAGSGTLSPATAAAALAIGKLTIGGDAKFTHITAGATGTLSVTTPDAAIGTVKIGGSLIASSISAGTDPVNGVFGDGDDKFVGGNAGNPTIIAKIASITIGGQILGTVGGPQDRFGIIAEKIGSITVGKVKLDIIGNQGDFLTGFTNDIHIREL